MRDERGQWKTREGKGGQGQGDDRDKWRMKGGGREEGRERKSDEGWTREGEEGEAKREGGTP
jgi:hypothetical protein